MTSKKLTINENFWLNFSKVYEKPSLVNKYLADYSDEIEKIVITNFNEFNLSSEYSIYANGGFGRREMFPSSDVDLSIVQHNKNAKNTEGLERYIAKLWDLGLKVGHSVRTIQDIKKVAGKDPVEFTSYLTSRSLVSSPNIDIKVNNILSRSWGKKKFFNAKYNEQEERYKSFFSTQYNLEPDLKESPGALRDFQTALWILQHCFDFDNYEDIKKSKEFSDQIDSAVESYDFIKVMRFATNITTKKNRLSFESQIEISKQAQLKGATNKRTVELMMQRYYENASNLSNFNNLIFESYRESTTFALTKNFGEFYVRGNKIGIKNGSMSKRKNLIFDIFIYIGKNKKINSIDTPTKILLKENVHLIDDNFRNDSCTSNQFLRILRSKYNLSSMLKTMKNLGILQAYIKEFGDVIGQMQFDLFHVYTVDEHTFKVLRNMRQMQIASQNGFELEYELINKLDKIEVLYLAGLFHDIGKGKGGDHSKIGAKISFDFAKKIGLSVADADLVSWLVLNHLQMSSISQKKDISDPETINSFAELVLNTERLNYLYLLTVNDIRATNPALWNGWKHSLLRDLFLLTRSKLNKEPIKTSNEIAADRKANVLKIFNGSQLDSINDYLDLFDAEYFNKNNSDKLKWQSGLVLKERLGEPVIGCRKCFEDLIEIFIKVDNSDGLFLKLVKILDLSGLEVIDANISTSGNNGIAANTFITKFSHHTRVLNNSEIREVKDRILDNFKSYSTFKKSTKKVKNLKSFKKILYVTNVEDKLKKRNLLTIETLDSPGLLEKIAKVLNENGTSIYSARINTLGDRVEDTFEIEDMTLSSVSKEKIQKITKALTELI